MPPRAAEKLHAGSRRWRPEDYASRLDQEIRDFIARTDRWFPPETVGLPIARLVAESHEGALELLPSVEGETGAHFLLRLPIAAAQ